MDFFWIACGVAGAFSAYLFATLAGGTGYGRVADYAMGIAAASLCPLIAISNGVVSMRQAQELPLASYLATGIVLALARMYRSADPVAWVARQRRR